MNRGFAIFLIVIVGCALFGWREYERQIRARLYQDRIKVKMEQEQQKQDQIKELENIEQDEKTKFKVQIPHDSRPETNTFPMILDATSSFDPDQGDRIRYSWNTWCIIIFSRM